MRRCLGTGVLVLVLLLPPVARADRGALTVEVAPALTWLPSPPPALGDGPGVSGSAGGGLLGVRYGLRNDLEVSATGFYEAPVTYYHSGVQLAAAGGTFNGVLSETTSRWGALVGVRYVRGLVWRLHVGAELGWAHQTYRNLDLVNVSDPSNPHSYGLGLKDVGRNAFVFAPLAGVEWQVGDHWSVAVTPRFEIMVGGVGRVAVLFPVSVGYSWFVF